MKKIQKELGPFNCLATEFLKLQLDAVWPSPCDCQVQMSLDGISNFSNIFLKNFKFKLLLLYLKSAWERLYCFAQGRKLMKINTNTIMCY